MKKIAVDIILFILMMTEFSRVYLPSEIHEIIGIFLVMLAVIHLTLNRNYLKNIAKGKYNKKRTAILISNVAFMTVFFLTCILGMISSQNILTFLNIGNMTAVYLHKILSYLCIILLGIHLGINLPIRKIKAKINNGHAILIICAITVIFGAYSFLSLDFFNHLTGNYGFSSSNGHILINILEYVAVTLMITILTDLCMHHK